VRKTPKVRCRAAHGRADSRAVLHDALRSSAVSHHRSAPCSRRYSTRMRSRPDRRDVRRFEDHESCFLNAVGTHTPALPSAACQHFEARLRLASLVCRLGQIEQHRCEQGSLSSRAHAADQIRGVFTAASQPPASLEAPCCDSMYTTNLARGCLRRVGMYGNEQVCLVLPRFQDPIPQWQKLVAGARKHRLDSRFLVEERGQPARDRRTTSFSCVP